MDAGRGTPTIVHSFPYQTASTHEVATGKSARHARHLIGDYYDDAFIIHRDFAKIRTGRGGALDQKHRL